MEIKYKDVCNTDFLISDVTAYVHKDKNTYDYSQTGRVKHIVFILLEGERSYYVNDDLVVTLEKGDVLFIPHGVKYKSVVENCDCNTRGYGVSFNIKTISGEGIFFDENMKVFKNDNYDKMHSRFKNIFYSALNQSKNMLKLKAEIYSLLEELFSDKADFNERYGDISVAINVLEKHPENNYSVKELADICHVSESTFLRKFKEFSGGIAPIKYRNNIRFMLAEEYAFSYSMSEIAEKLGFYDAAHLCKQFKKERGYTLKNITTKKQ